MTGEGLGGVVEELINAAHTLRWASAAPALSQSMLVYVLHHPVLALVGYVAVAAGAGLAIGRCAHRPGRMRQAAPDRTGPRAERTSEASVETALPGHGSAHSDADGVTASGGFAAPEMHVTPVTPLAGIHTGAGRPDAGMLAPFCSELERWHRLAAAEARLAAALAQLPDVLWRVERNPVIAGHRIPFLVLGATGVFVLWAETSLPHYDEIPVAHTAANSIEQLLPGYAGRVQPGLCRVFAATDEPQLFCRPDKTQARAWIIPGADSVIPWLLHFGTDDGLTPAELTRLDELTRPRWEPARRALPNIPFGRP